MAEMNQNVKKKSCVIYRTVSLPMRATVVAVVFELKDSTRSFVIT